MSAKASVLCSWTALGLFLVSPLIAVADPESLEVEVRRDIVYHRVGERELLLDAYLPEDDDEANPAVLIIHGGGWRTGDRKQLQAYARGLAERGFACFAIDYRLAPEHEFPAQIEDCRSAVKWVRANADEYGADPAQIGALGYSAGGHLALLLGTSGEAGEGDSRLQAVVAGGAPGDFEWFPDNGKWAEFLMGGDLATAKDNFHNASPSVFADESDPPVFMYHGAADKIVPLVWPKECHKLLVKAGIRAEMHVVPEAGHFGTIADITSLQKAYEFLAKELGLAGEAVVEPDEAE